MNKKINKQDYTNALMHFKKELNDFLENINAQVDKERISLYRNDNHVLKNDLDYAMHDVLKTLWGNDYYDTDIIYSDEYADFVGETQDCIEKAIELLDKEYKK